MPMARRTSVVLISAVAAIIVLGGVAGVISATRSASQGDPSTPEGAVQVYLQAISRGDVDAAGALLLSEGPCTIGDLSRTYLPGSLRAVLTSSSSTDSDTAVVRVEVTEGGADEPFGSSGYGHTESFLLERTGGTWFLTEVPWPMYDCSGVTP